MQHDHAVEDLLPLCCALSSHNTRARKGTHAALLRPAAPKVEAAGKVDTGRQRRSWLSCDAKHGRMCASSHPHTPDEARASPHEAADFSSTEGDVEAAASKYMDELTARVLASSSAIQDHRGDITPAPDEDEAPLTDGDLDSKTAESLEKFMSTLKEHLQLEQDTWDMSQPSASTSALPLSSLPTTDNMVPMALSPLPPRERVHTLTPDEHCAKVAHLVREHMQQEAHGMHDIVPGSLTPPLMTKIRCVHASVAQKS